MCVISRSTKLAILSLYRLGVFQSMKVALIYKSGSGVNCAVVAVEGLGNVGMGFVDWCVRRALHCSSQTPMPTRSLRRRAASALNQFRAAVCTRLTSMSRLLVLWAQVSTHGPLLNSKFASSRVLLTVNEQLRRTIEKEPACFTAPTTW